MFQTRHTTILRKPLILLGFLLFVCLHNQLIAQPTQLGTQTVNGAYTSYALSDLGIFRQVRVQATSSALSGTRNWEFYEAPFDYDPAWRPYTGGLTLAGYNMNIFPTAGTAAALFNTGFGGSAGLMPTIANGYYYTFNVTEYSTAGVPQNEYMGVVETSYNPVVISSVLQSPAAGAVYPENSVYVTVTTAAIPSAGENIFVRYSTSVNFLSSTLLPVTMSGTTGTVEIPCQSVGTTIYYYAYSSNRTAAAILTDVGSTGERAHDMSTLNINNNGGPNYSYTVAPSIGYCGDYYVPSSCFPTIASFVSALNSGSVSCDVICHVAAGHTETAPVGGINLTQTGTAANTISFIKEGAGANPVITAQVGTVTLGAGSTVADGVFSLNGSDYITIDGIDIQDNNASAPGTMEYGYALYKASATDGCSNNTIKNCTITLSRLNSSVGPTAFQTGSRGIFTANCTRTALGTSLIISTVGGRNDNNSFLGNTISNVFAGIILRGYYDSSPSTYFDQGNIVGAPGDGNTITNYAGSSANAGYGIYAIYQGNLTISGNTINNRQGGVSHTNTLYGIFHSANTTTTSGGSTITYNDISLGQGANTNSVFAIRTGTSGQTGGSVNISNNTIHDCTFDAGASGQFYGIYQEFNNTSSNIDNNTFEDNNLNTTNANTYLIYDNSVTSAMTVDGNYMNNNSVTTTGTVNLYGYYYINTSATGTISVSNNTIDSLMIPTSSTGYVIGIRVSNSTNQIKTIASNTISNIRAGSGTTLWTCGMYIDKMATGSSVTNNNVSNVSSTSNVVGINCADDNSINTSLNQVFTLSGNQVNNITSSGNSAQMAGIAIYALNAVSCFNNSVDSVIASGSSPSQIKGINFGGGTSGNNLDIYQNVISNIRHNNTLGASTPTGIYLFPNTVTTNIYNNHIFDISGTGSDMVIGMYGTSGTGTYNVYNNFIQRLSAPNSSLVTAVNGMYVAASGNTYNVYNNTIAIGQDAVIGTTGLDFGVSGFYHGAGLLNLQNNIIYVNANANGAGVVSCVRKATPGTAGTAPATTVISAASNNNFYYINPAASNYVYVEGGNTSTIKNGYAYSSATTSVTNNLNNDPCFNVLTAGDITSYKYFMSLSGGGSRENNSFYDVPNFVGGATLPDNLKIITGTNDYAESHASTLALVTTDYEGDLRQGVGGYAGTGSAPDIGADEGEFVLVSPVCDLLPIELVEFTGWYNGTENELHWTTATEINSDYFEIQRSLNGIDFIPIGSMPAAGNSMELLHYVFYDDAPAPGVNYYRLKMVDIGGAFEYSNIIAIRLTNENLQQISVYPNPATEQITIAYIASEKGLKQINFYDATGRIVIGETTQLEIGVNMLHYDIAKLPAATYVIQFTNPVTGEIEGIKFIKY